MTGLEDDHEVLGVLHRAPATEVCLVRSRSRGGRFVLKRLRTDDDTARRELLREGRLLSSLSHPHVVRAVRFAEEPAPALVLELLPGQTLARTVAPGARRFSAGALAELGTALCSALAYVHARGVLHLDVKPSNVMVHRGAATLIDFGSARPPGRLRSPAGTPRLRSPEQARGGDVGPATDVWGLGTVLFRAATARDVSGVPVGPLARMLPRRLAEAIDGALDQDPASRPTVAEIADALPADAA